MLLPLLLGCSSSESPKMPLSEEKLNPQDVREQMQELQITPEVLDYSSRLQNDNNYKQCGSEVLGNEGFYTREIYDLTHMQNENIRLHKLILQDYRDEPSVSRDHSCMKNGTLYKTIEHYSYIREQESQLRFEFEYQMNGAWYYCRLDKKRNQNLDDYGVNWNFRQGLDLSWDENMGFVNDEFSCDAPKVNGGRPPHAPDMLWSALHLLYQNP